MKIKPTIKTHWLASQNPLNISLGEIESVLFYPNSALFLFEPKGQDLRFLPAEEVAVAPAIFQKQVPAKEIARNCLLKMSLSADNTSRDIFSELFSCLKIRTMRGEIRSLSEADLLETLPAMLNIKYYLEDKSISWERSDSPAAKLWLSTLLVPETSTHYLAVSYAWLAIHEILAWSLQRKRQIQDLKVQMCWLENGTSRERALDEIEIHQGLELSGQVRQNGSIGFKFDLRINRFVPSAENTLILYDGKNYIRAFEKLSQLSQLSLEQVQVSETGSKPETSIKYLASSFEILDPNVLAKAVEEIRPTLSGGDLEIQAQQVVHKEDIGFRIGVNDDSENSRILLSIYDKKSSKDIGSAILPLSYITESFLTPLRSQLPKLEASKPWTGHDYLLLQHLGVNLFCWLEIFNMYLGLPQTSGQLIEASGDQKDRLELLMSYFKSVIPSLLGKGDAHFASLISNPAAEVFKLAINKCFEKIEGWKIFCATSAGVLDLTNSKENFSRLIRFIILEIFEESNAKVFFKSNFNAKNDSALKILRQFSPGIEVRHEIQFAKIGFSSWELLFELHDQGMELFYNGKAITNDSSLEFMFNVNDSKDQEAGKASQWFDLHPEIFFNGVKVANEDLNLQLSGQHYGFVEYKGQIYRIDKKQLPSLKTLQRFWRRIQIKNGTGFKQSLSQKLRLEKSRALELLMLKQLGFNVQVSGEWKVVFDYFDQGLGKKTLDLPEEIAKSLLPYQKDGAQWLWDLYQLRLGAILADEMGLGKTFQVLSFLATLYKNKNLQKCLVVVPTSLLYNWLEEEKKFKLNLPLTVVNSLKKEELQRHIDSSQPEIILTTYGFMLENSEIFQKPTWNVLIFDEAQALKNINSLRTVTAKKIRAKFKVCLTGTPMENNYLEFFSLCDLVVPGCLGDIASFRKDFRSIEVRSDLIRELKLTSKPLLMRRTKAQVKLNLPEKTLHQVHLPFEEQQKNIYKQMAMTFSKQVEKIIQEQGEVRAQLSMFSALMRLRQICSDPSAVPGVQYTEKPAKIGHFLNSIDEHIEDGESVIVFTQFLATLERLRAELAQRGIPHFLLKGSVPSQERLRLISEFNKSETPAVMLMTLKTGGVGLNLTKASIVYHLEPWWNPAVENQATDRAHRMGQTKNVRVFNLLIEGSLEQRISELKERKQKAFDKLFAVTDETVEAQVSGDQLLSKEDFFYLLRNE